MENELTKEDLQILHHTLGITDPYSNSKPYRNCFVAGENHHDMPTLQKLVGLELMEKENDPFCVTDYVFYATEKGKAIALKTRPKVNRHQMRYHKFLSMRDVFEDLTFREFLTNPYFAEHR